MARHTGIDQKENSITDALTELNLADKKYVDDQDSLHLLKSGGSMTGPLGMSNNQIWDVSSPTLDKSVANKKYVDDQDNLKLAKPGGSLLGELSMDSNKITDLATPTNNSDAATKKSVDDNSSSQITVKDAAYTTGYLSARRVNVDGDRIYTEVDNLTNATINHPQIVSIRLGFNNSVIGFAFSSGKTSIIWEGFNNLSGSVLKASLTVASPKRTPFTKIKLLYSNDTSGIFATEGDISDKLSGSFGVGSHIISVSSQTFTNMRYLTLYLKSSTSISLINIALSVVLIIA